MVCKEKSCVPNVDHGSASKVEIKSVTKSQNLNMDFTITEENLIKAANYNRKLQPKLTPRNQPLKNMYTEHQQPTVQNTTRRAESNSQKLCKEEQAQVKLS